MAWSAPFTAVANTVFTAAQWNQYGRDNLNETAPAKATAAGQIFVSVAANSIAARTPATQYIGASESTTSGTYVDLTTAGPAVTVTCGQTALVGVYANISDATAGQWGLMSAAVSGASTIAAADNLAISCNTGGNIQVGAIFHYTGLTGGSNTFTCKYRSSGGSTATFALRRITVIPL